MESKNELEVPLRKAVESQVIAFSEFSGKNYLLDSLLQNLKDILIKFPVDPRSPTPARKKIRLDVSESLGHSNGSADLKGMAPEIPCKAVSDVFTTDLIMLKTMSYLSIPELKTCRLVNSGLKSYATEVLSKRKDMHITFRYCPESFKFFHAAWINAPQFELSHFTNFLTTCSGFPCNSYSFESGSLCVLELQKFLNVHGSKVQKLSIDAFESRGTNFSDSDKPTLPMLRKLLLEQVSHLKSLELKQCPEEWNNCPEELFGASSGSRINLPQLKSLAVNYSVPESVFGAILLASTRLQELEADSAKYSKIVQANKLHLLQWFYCLLTSERLEFYRNLPYTQLRCKELWLNIDLDDINSLSNPEVLTSGSRIITNLLQANSRTLKKIEFHKTLNFFPSLQLPVMPEVVTVLVSLTTIAQNTNKVFPPGFEFTSTFPQLTTIILDLMFIEPENLWIDFFDPFEPVQSVKYLVLDHVTNLPLKWMNKISASFPNVRMLKVNRDESVLDCDAIFPQSDFSMFKHLKFVNFDNE